MSDWISIKDKLPPINKLILVYDKSRGIVTLHAIFDLELFKSTNSLITHWMNIPEVPI